MESRPSNLRYLVYAVPLTVHTLSVQQVARDPNL